MGLNGIDISSWQDDLVPAAMSTTDFIIVKATGGAGYSNECFKRHADATLAAGKLLGCYHHARDRGYKGSAEAEADHFIDAFKPYIGKAIPFLDWEADALGLGVAWAKAWLDRVKAKTGVTPGIYTSKSVCFAYDWSSVAKTYPLWVAQYPNYEETGYKSEPWTDGWEFGAWKDPLIFQYTSTGRIAGYGGNLDLDLFYGAKADWQRLCKASGVTTTEEAGNLSRQRGSAGHGAPVQLQRARLFPAGTASCTTTARLMVALSMAAQVRLLAMWQILHAGLSRASSATAMLEMPRWVRATTRCRLR